MKKVIFKFSILLLSSTLTFTACKKKTDPQPADDTAAQTQNGGDDANATSESDAALNDANAAISGSITMNGARIDALPPGVSSIVYDTAASSPTAKTVTITYDPATSVNGRKRSGTLKAYIPKTTNWTTAGATLTLTFNNLKATRDSDGKSITLNGTKSVTNVSGGNMKTLGLSTPLVHKIRSTNMTLTFDDGTTRTWNVARTRTITKSAITSFSISTSGDTTIAGYSNVAMWGTTRAGNTFYSIISTPLVWNNTTCSSTTSFVPVSGVRVIQGLDRTLTITYGVDQTGSVTSACPYGFKLYWVNIKGEARTVIRPY